MTKTTVHLVVSINGCTLVVFYTEAHCWQFRVISSGSAVNGYAQDLLLSTSGRESGAGVDR